MGTSSMKWPLTLVRLGGPCLLIVLICLATGSVRSGRSPAIIRVLSDAEMASVVGDATGYCVGSFDCKSGVVETNVCAWCDNSAQRTLCCPTSTTGCVDCGFGSVTACGTGTTRYTTATYTSTSCNSCTGGGGMKSGNCDSVNNVKNCTKMCQ